MNSKQPKYKVEFFYRPGQRLHRGEIATLQDELRNVASHCFDEIPEYQCLEKSPTALGDKVITVAQNKEGKIVGFCSALLIPMEGLGEVLHLGLTCVDPVARGHRLTHKLTSKLLMHYLLRHRPFSKVWVSNVACVLSSLGNVAKNFENVFPSPYYQAKPTVEQLTIAAAIDQHYRKDIAISEDAEFCPHTFLFKGSVKGSVFEKEESDSRYYHRNKELNQFYMDLIQFERGDEVLQVCSVSLATLARYLLRRTAPLNITAAAELKLAAGVADVHGM